MPGASPARRSVGVEHEHAGSVACATAALNRDDASPLTSSTYPRGTVAAFTATTTVGYGVLFYAYGVLLVPMEADLKWCRSFLSGAFSLALVVAALLTVPVWR